MRPSIPIPCGHGTAQRGEWLTLLGAGALEGLLTRATVETERVLARVDMVAIAGRMVDLHPVSTGRVRGLCPLHWEQTPSFTVDPWQRRWHCFGCAEGGDAFDFVMRTEGVGFDEAVRILATRFPAG